MSGAKVVLGADLIEKLTRTREAGEAAHKTAEAIIDTARGLAPEAEGNYLAGLQVVVTRDADGREIVKAAATDPKSLWIEYGTAPRQNAAGANRGEMPAYRPIGRAVETLGLKLIAGRGP